MSGFSVVLVLLSLQSGGCMTSGANWFLGERADSVGMAAGLWWPIPIGEKAALPLEWLAYGHRWGERPETVVDVHEFAAGVAWTPRGMWTPDKVRSEHGDPPWRKPRVWPYCGGGLSIRQGALADVPGSKSNRMGIYLNCGILYWDGRRSNQLGSALGLELRLAVSPPFDLGGQTLARNGIQVLLRVMP